MILMAKSHQKLRVKRDDFQAKPEKLSVKRTDFEGSKEPSKAYNA